MLSLPRGILFETLPAATETAIEDKSLLALLVDRLSRLPAGDRRIDSLAKLCCMVEGIAGKRRVLKRETAFQSVKGYWKDANEVLNSYSRSIDLLAPIAFFVPSADSRESAAASYKKYPIRAFQ